MPLWLELASGPLMRFTLAILLLGLLRLIILTAWDLVIAVRRANDKRIPYGTVFTNTLSWLLPFKRIGRTRHFYSIASFTFHIGILASTIFLGNHIEIINRIIGLRWIAITKPIIDLLALVMILSGSYLLATRIYAPASRALSKSMDYVLLIILLGISSSGYVAGQSWNPIPYDLLMLGHTLMAGALLLAIPFTKISHCVLFPLIRLSSEIAWHFPPDAGRKVTKTLHGTEVREI